MTDVFFSPPLIPDVAITGRYCVTFVTIAEVLIKEEHFAMRTILAIATGIVLTTSVTTQAENTVPGVPWTAPSAEVTSYRVLARDGWYNMPTDILSWNDLYWLSYRRGTGHRSANSRIVLLRSNDLRRWHEVQLFESPYGLEGTFAIAMGHFCVADQRLFMFLGVRKPSDQGNITLAHIFVTWTGDGVNWSKPELLSLGDLNPYPWRVRYYQGKFYNAVTYLAENEHVLDLITSDDGVHWERHSRIADTPPAKQKYFTEESELLWRPDGELWCVVRTGSAHMYWSKPPYTSWQGGIRIGWCDAPAMCETGGQVYVAGRGPAKVVLNPNEIGGKKGAPTLFRLTQEGVEPLVSFPAGGDCSYPGLISPEPGKLIMSFYSDVAYQSGQVKPKFHDAYGYKRTACDIYLAEIKLLD